MRVLLHTHCFVWFNLNDSRLTTAARNIIQDRNNPVLISPASFWEIAIKISRGAFSLSAPYELFWQAGIDDNGFSILPIELRHTNRLISLPFHHKDPFDRLLAAQALAEKISFLSSDPVFDSYGVERIW